MKESQETVLTNSPEETQALAERTIRELDAPALFLLIGDLGSGKTVFAKGLAAGLGIDPHEIISPSFALIAVHHGRWPFYHIDLYRLDDPRDMFEHLGLDEILASPAVVAIEWGEKLPLASLRAEPESGEPPPAESPHGRSLDHIYRVEILWVDETTRQVSIRREASRAARS